MDPIITDVDVIVAARRSTAIARGMAMAYVWGRQDAGESDRDTGFSMTFAAVYAMAHHLGDGYGVGPIQAAYHEWHETGRVLVRHGERVVQVAATGPHNRVDAYPIPWAGDRHLLPYWHGLVKQPEVTDATA